MNKKRRIRIEKVVSTLEDMSAEISDIMQEEQEAYDNMPESLQYSERGERMSEIVDAFDSIISDIDYIIEQLTETTA